MRNAIRHLVRPANDLIVGFCFAAAAAVEIDWGFLNKFVANVLQREGRRAVMRVVCVTSLMALLD